MSQLRSGTVLIIVAGITAILLSLSAALVVMTRSEAKEGELLIQDSQARIMLPAALNFIQECSRLGWGDETYGWVDVRNGTTGPRGPRDTSTGRIPDPVWGAGFTADDSESDSSLAVGATYDPTPATTPFDPPPTASTSATWPAPGSVYRADMYAMVQPPHALQLKRFYNPISTDPGLVEEWERAYDGTDVQSAKDTVIGKAVTPTDAWVEANGWNSSKNAKYSSDWWGGRYDIMRNVWKDTFTNSYTNFEPGNMGLRNPQPIANTLTEYLNGNKGPLIETTGRSWFRVYRETPADHDGNGTPYYDRVPISGCAVFVVTCGSGGTKGFRNWSEVSSTGNTGLFAGDSDLFDELRAAERILWYRVEWTAHTGGGYDTWSHYNNANNQGDTLSGLLSGNGGLGPTNWGNVGGKIGASNKRLDTINTVLNYCGSFKWIQRLEQEPPTW